jgi:hypothetical protein
MFFAWIFLKLNYTETTKFLLYYENHTFHLTLTHQISSKQSCFLLINVPLFTTVVHTDQICIIKTTYGQSPSNQTRDTEMENNTQQSFIHAVHMTIRNSVILGYLYKV